MSFLDQQMIPFSSQMSVKQYALLKISVDLRKIFPYISVFPTELVPSCVFPFIYGTQYMLLDRACVVIEMILPVCYNGVFLNQ